MPTPLKTGARPHVVIVGGGFGGLYAARSLAKYPVDITVIDKENYHLFQPLLYQIATAALSAGDIASPIRSILRKYKNVRVIMGEVNDVDVAGKRVVLDEGDFHFDYLVVATGATGTYFGHDEWAEFAPGLKTVEDALDIRRRLFLAYESAERLPTGSPERDAFLSFVVIGGGPTGVEMAGAIREIASQTLKGDFRSIDPTHAKVILLQSGPRILPEYPDDLSDTARKYLERMGVEVHTGSRVTNITAEGVHVGETFIPAKTVVWGAGVLASPLGKTLGVPLDKGGRVIVNPDLSIPGYGNVFVIGDLANSTPPGKDPLPGIAPTAIQMGIHVAKNIAALVAGEPATDFVYDDRGMLATIGRNSAVGIAKGHKVKGFIAWLMWLLIHIYFLIGFENRALVMMNWAYSYMSFTRSARLITGGTRKAPAS
ncbi:NADH dehydrogenase [Abditibacterium utsteinense]|uniref:NADH dehydrogenase n=1 Tax=Abditibacterium utsteinense TaxID=1960156 RepID=A0A2S8SUJ2_9BACT|nr:NAD(P)/FAD-dependent oxidoreductase [Abditibacterium utsteinense]PQV64458.1 NADH dehydrogenase [Abditibacterium utsteinense]